MVASEKALPRLWTGEAVLDRALEVAGFKAEDLVNSMQRMREGLDAEMPQVTKYGRDGQVREVIEGGPDHPIRLRAAENIFEWLGFRGARKPAEAGSGPVTLNVVIVNGDAPQSPQGNGRSIRVLGGNGHGHPNGKPGA
jgi:hypothetical protein